MVPQTNMVSTQVMTARRPVTKHHRLPKPLDAGLSRLQRPSRYISSPVAHLPLFAALSKRSKIRNADPALARPFLKGTTRICYLLPVFSASSNADDYNRRSFLVMFSKQRQWMPWICAFPRIYRRLTLGEREGKYDRKNGMSV